MNHKEKGVLDIIFDFFRSLKLTTFLLILLAIVSIIGTAIKQNAQGGSEVSVGDLQKILPHSIMRISTSNC